MNTGKKVIKPKWIQQWFNKLISESNFRVKPINLVDSDSWLITDGAIRHKSGLFFSIVGVVWENVLGQVKAQPMIEQREVGTLGFLLRKHNNTPQLLIQAKIEPGNVGVAQLAPTCQATASNTARVHGGKLPLFVEDFYPNSKLFIYETLESEQGSRFLGKQNRNVLALAKDNLAPSAYHKWVDVSRVLKLLTTDFLINTDARSVLVCSPWEVLLEKEPFSQHKAVFVKELRASYTSKKSAAKISAIKAKIDLLRGQTKPIRLVDIGHLKGWQLTKSGLTARRAQPFSVKQIQVRATTREVPEWDQPIIDSAGIGLVELACGRQKGILHFLFRPQVEVGLHNYVQFGPSFLREPGGSTDNAEIPSKKPGAKIVSEFRQSDEGGRFFHDINRYKLVDVGETYLVSEGWCWLTLSEIRSLLDQGGWFTNEARSALSILLRWL